jgi:hypothetical protein
MKKIAVGCATNASATLRPAAASGKTAVGPFASLAHKRQRNGLLGVI